MIFFIIIFVVVIFFIIFAKHKDNNRIPFEEEIGYDINKFYNSNFKTSVLFEKIFTFDTYEIIKIDIKNLSLAIENKYEKTGQYEFINLYNKKKKDFIYKQNLFENDPENLLLIYLDQGLNKEDFMKLKVYELLTILIMNYYIDYKKNGHSKELKNLLLYGAMFRVNKNSKKICFATETNHSIPILEIIN